MESNSDFIPQYSIGHFINEPGNPTNFEVTRFETMNEPDIEDIHTHAFFEILWVDEGRSYQEIDFQSYELGAGSLFLISPGQVHKFEEWQPLFGGTILFTEEFYLMNQRDDQALFEISYLESSEPLLTPPEEDFKQIKHTIDLLLRENEQAQPRDNIFQSLLHVLIQQMQRCYMNKDGHVTSSQAVITYKKFKTLLEKSYQHGFGASYYSDALHITSRHLNRICRELTGYTTSMIIEKRRILEAKRLLVFSASGIGEIAGMLGYLDSTYFSRVFRKSENCSPMEFRRTMSEKYRS